MITTLLERRLFIILEMLTNNKGVVLEDFSEELGVSTRSIRTYLKQLQEEIPRQYSRNSKRIIIQSIN